MSILLGPLCIVSIGTPDYRKTGRGVEQHVFHRSTPLKTWTICNETWNLDSIIN